jgi:predicted metal-dependent hydrolase
LGASPIFLRRKTPKPRAVTTTELIQPPFPLSVPLEFRQSARARRLSLRVDHARGRVVLVAPMAVARRHAIDFLMRQEGWLTARVAQLSVSQPFADGETIPVMGVPHLIKGDSSRLRGLPTRADGAITVPGAPDHLARRLADFLKAEAKREIGARARVKAGRLGRPIAAVTLRDTRSRWGSCTGAGRLAFSWRLIMAPEWVLDYVVAHEVAHLAEMNHGVRFWKLCAGLTESDPKAARAWLKRHGGALHAYG